MRNDLVLKSAPNPDYEFGAEISTKSFLVISPH